MFYCLSSQDITSAIVPNMKAYFLWQIEPVLLSLNLNTHDVQSVHETLKHYMTLTVQSAS